MDNVDINSLIVKQKRSVKKDKECAFCEGNEHQTPQEIMALRNEGYGPNEKGWRVRVVPDKKPVLQIYAEMNSHGHGLYDVLDGVGAHEIVIETPNHDETIVDLSEDQITEIYWTYKERILDLKEDSRLRYVLIHKNYGQNFGVTSNHSYSFVIGTPVTPRRVKDELVHSREYYNFKERCLFCDIIYQELYDKERVIVEDGKFIAFVPFASPRPFEVWILPRKHETFFELTLEHRSLAKLTREILKRIHKLLKEPDYIMAIHSGPNTNAGRIRGYWQSLNQDYHWHIEIMPRLKSYTSFDVSAGFPVNSVPPEKAAAMLRDL